MSKGLADLFVAAYLKRRATLQGRPYDELVGLLAASFAIHDLAKDGVTFAEPAPADEGEDSAALIARVEKITGEKIALLPKSGGATS